MNSFKLKIIALITMFTDHFAYLFTPAINGLIYIGRFAFPIFAFQASIGYKHTRDLKKYIIRLLFFAFLSQIPFTLFFEETGLNVIFTILIGVISILIYDELVKRNLYPLALFSLVIFAFFAEILKTDYGCFGILIIFVFHICQNRKIIMMISYTLLIITRYSYQMLMYGVHEVWIYQMIFTLVAIIPILFYNNKEGKKTKYLLYTFYPLHLLLLYFIKIFL